MIETRHVHDLAESGRPRVTVIGAGPAGLMAAETLAAGGALVTVHDRMPTLGRKFLMAGRGGLNLTHSEPLERLLIRYRPQAEPLMAAIQAFPPAALRGWCAGLGISTFEGSSGRVFPSDLKASPLLRVWLARLGSLGVQMKMRSRWTGWDSAGTPCFENEAIAELPAATVLAMGGASWPRLGSDGLWPQSMPGLSIAAWAPSNMGFEVNWSEHFRDRHAGAPLKRIAMRFDDQMVLGEAVVTHSGLEGGAIYALSAVLRDAMAKRGPVVILLDLRPDLTLADVANRLASRPRAESLSNGLRKALSLSPAAIGLVQEALRSGGANRSVASLVKGLPIQLMAVSAIARAISSAGGIAWSELDDRLMIRSRPGVFACGEMLDWEAPTGGYLLQGCFSTGVAAAQGVLAWLNETRG